MREKWSKGYVWFSIESYYFCKIKSSISFVQNMLKENLYCKYRINVGNHSFSKGYELLSSTCAQFYKVNAFAYSVKDPILLRVHWNDSISRDSTVITLLKHTYLNIYNIQITT